MSNNRIFFAVQSASIAADGTNTFSGIHGLQQIGISTKFNLEQVFEIGQIEVYQNIENIPDIEATVEKVVDGYPLIYHLATYPSTNPSLVGRSTTKAILGLSVYSDQQSSASGTAISQAQMSGVFVSSLSYAVGADANLTESVSLVGNQKVWNSAFTAPTFSNNDVPGSGVYRRQDILMGSGQSLFPTDIVGIDTASSKGNNLTSTNGNYNVHFQGFRINTNLGRTAMFELGHKGPYFRFVPFPVQVNTELDVMATDGDHVTALQESNNTVDQPIKIQIRDGHYFDLGTRNRLVSCTYGGGNAGSNGGNVTWTYSYLNFNDLIVHHAADPSGL